MNERLLASALTTNERITRGSAVEIDAVARELRLSKESPQCLCLLAASQVVVVAG
jgi:hypothetical protein